jgi:hypothetical protein
MLGFAGSIKKRTEWTDKEILNAIMLAAERGEYMASRCVACWHPCQPNTLRPICDCRPHPISEPFKKYICTCLYDVTVKAGDDLA